MKDQTPLLTVPSRPSLRKHAFYGILALVSLLGLGITQSAKANYIVTMQQVGSNVVANGSGAFDLTGLTFQQTTNVLSGIVPNLGVVQSGQTPSVKDVYTGGITGQTNFGSGDVRVADTDSGNFAGIQPGFGLLLVPQGYLSGAALSNSMTFNNRNFASLGVIPGTYEWTWGTGANQNFTLVIGTVPDAGSTLPLLGFASLGLVALRRKLGRFRA